jgi:hypothetical protein
LINLGGKKATLCAWMTLQSIPQETIITPNILEFLEQVTFQYYCQLMVLEFNFAQKYQLFQSPVGT